jgi:hypothetical protein
MLILLSLKQMMTARFEMMEKKMKQNAHLAIPETGDDRQVGENGEEGETECSLCYP